MNIECYYYAVKFLAFYAGFRKENSIQTIAATAQFVDDQCGEVKRQMDPEKLEDSELGQIIRDRKLYAEVSPGAIAVTLPQTAPLPMTDPQWKSDYASAQKQWDCLVPFHYYPPAYLDFDNPADYRTVPCAPDAHPDAPFHALCENAMDRWEGESGNDDDDEAGLMFMGAVCHIIGASFANERLNGFDSWINRAYIIAADTADLHKRVKHDTIDPADDANFYVQEHLWKNPSVGHARLGSALTDGGLDIVFYHAKDEGDGEEDSDPILGGTRTFLGQDLYLAACKTIFGFLLRCNGENPPDYENVWNATLRPKLAKLYGTWRPDRAGLPAKWKAETELDYDYNADTFRDRFIRVAESPDHLFRYVILVDDIRRSVKQAQKGQS